MPTDIEGLVVASNRGPVSWQRVGDRLEPARGAGGLIVALGGALQAESGTWVSVALDEADREVAAQHGDKPFTVDTPEGSFCLRLVDAGERFHAYYNQVANRLLWFTVHELWGAPYEPRGVGWRSDWFYGYEPVNEAVARAVVEEAADGKEVPAGLPPVQRGTHRASPAARGAAAALPAYALGRAGTLADAADTGR
jgi:trehalose 6-phosphate synthase